MKTTKFISPNNIKIINTGDYNWELNKSHSFGKSHDIWKMGIWSNESITDMWIILFDTETLTISFRTLNVLHQGGDVVFLRLDNLDLLETYVKSFILGHQLDIGVLYDGKAALENKFYK